jgi:integrase
VSRRFKQHLHRAGLPPQRFHDLRHVSASFLAAEGVPMRTAMDILGHNNISTTAEAYQHVAENSKREATERVAALLWS